MHEFPAYQAATWQSLNYWFVAHLQHLRNYESPVISSACSVYVLPVNAILCKPNEGSLSTIGRAVFAPTG